MGVRAGKSNAVTRDLREFCYRLDDLVGPLQIESDGVDINYDRGLIVVGKYERRGIERHIGAQAALVSLRSPAALGHPGGRSKVSTSYTRPQVAHGLPPQEQNNSKSFCPQRTPNIIHVRIMHNTKLGYS